MVLVSRHGKSARASPSVAAVGCRVRSGVNRVALMSQFYRNHIARVAVDGCSGSAGSAPIHSIYYYYCNQYTVRIAIISHEWQWFR